MQVVVVPRHTLSRLPEDAASLIPAAQAMRDHDLVPEGAGGVDGGHAVDRQVELCCILADIGPDCDEAVGIER